MSETPNEGAGVSVEGQDEREWTVYEHAGGREIGMNQEDDWKEPVVVVPKARLDAALVESEARERELQRKAAHYDLARGEVKVEGNSRTAYVLQRDAAFERAEKAEADRAVLVEALKEMADPENWAGNPLSQEATLYGHFTPYELARDALAGVVEAEPEPREEFKRRLAKAVEENREALDLLAADDGAEPDGSEQ